ncbi:hypothetical protein SLS53_001682 [Cytospora paraplurivora]|uniref:Heterokaryon incompatibility domain-containing protein n=1 Tax=Cytospora paraplurivora TaxID=2898453 RepID=A0AAN9UGS4_9PEZI
MTKDHQISHSGHARLGPLLPPLSKYLREKTARSAFELEQQLWTHLAGEQTWYWRRTNGKRAQPDKPLYAPLDAAKREIRVLRVSRVLPADVDNSAADNNNEAFKADLLHVSLDDDPPYIAVSYTWGDPKIIGRFKSDQEGAAGIEYNQSVSKIVNTLVPMGSTLHLWIDALCINQRDYDEKGTQVALMGEIYKKARQVVVFLGEADEGTTANMDLIQRAGPILEKTFSTSSISASRSPYGGASLELSELANESIKAGIPMKELLNHTTDNRLKLMTRLNVEFIPDHPRIANLHGCVVDEIMRLSPVKRPVDRFTLTDIGQWMRSVLQIVKETKSGAPEHTSSAPEGDVDSDDTSTGLPGVSGREYHLLYTLLASPRSDVRLDGLGKLTIYLYLAAECSPFDFWDAYWKRCAYRGWAETEFEDVAQMSERSSLTTGGRRFFVSSKGYFGLAPPGTREGDLVCAFPGMIVPVIIRRDDSEVLPPPAPTNYILVGEAYHEGLVQGNLEVDPNLMGPIRLV